MFRTVFLNLLWPLGITLCLVPLAYLGAQDPSTQNPDKPDVSGDTGKEMDSSSLSDAPDIAEEARKESQRKESEIEQVIGYGIDSDLVTTIQAQLREARPLPHEGDDKIQWIETSPYNDAIFQRIKKGYSSNELQAEALHFFMRQKWLGAQEYATDLIVRHTEKSDIDTNLLLATLAYLRQLEVRSSETAVLGLLQDEKIQVLEQCILSLGKIGSSASSVKLLQLLQDEGNSFTDFNNREQEILRIAAIHALGNQGYLPAADYLLGILQDTDESTHSNVEWGAAAKALGQINQVEALDLILAQFPYGNSQKRFQIIEALSAFPPQPGKAEDIILQGLQEAYWKTRMQAAKAAGDLGLQSAIPALAYKAGKDSVAGVRRAAIQALRKLGTAGNTQLRDLLENPDIGELQRLDVLQTLIKARDTSIVSIFRHLLLDESQYKLSRSGLFRIASTNPWDALDFVYREMLFQSKQKVRLDALRAISRGRIQALLASVQELAESDEDASIRRAAKKTLASLSP